MKHIRSLFHSVIAFISAIAIILGVASPAGAEDVAIQEGEIVKDWKPVPKSEAPEGFYDNSGADLSHAANPGAGVLIWAEEKQLGDALDDNGIPRSDSLGICADYGLVAPEGNKGNKYAAPIKLTYIFDYNPDHISARTAGWIPFEGDIRDSAINVAKQMLNAWNRAKSGDETAKNDFAKYSVALQILLSTTRSKNGVFGYSANGGTSPWANGLDREEFKKITGFEQVNLQSTDTPTFKRATDVDIPKAGDDEYLTVIEPLVGNNS